MRSSIATLFGWVAALVFVTADVLEAAPRPLALHPDNPHYFLFRGNPAVLIGSGEHYGAVLNREFDYVAYLRELRDKGLNHTRLFSGTYREVPSSFGITDNTLAPKPEQFLSPWARSDAPGEFYGGNKFDLTRWDELFFSRLKDFIRQAGKRGIVVEINLFCPLYGEELWQVNPMNARNNINGVGQCPRNEVLTLQHRDMVEVHKAVTRKFVTELNGFDNIYYEVCNEPWVGGVTTEWQDEIIATIVETQSQLPNQHLISLNLQGLNIRSPNPAVSIFNYHHADSAEPVMRNYALNKVIGDNETGFRGPGNFAYRTEAWDCILAGGALFSHLDYSFSTQHPAGTLREYKSPGGGNAELRRQFRVLKDFIHDFDYIRMTPAPTVIEEIEPGGSVVTQVLAESGRAYAIYARRRSEVDRVTVRWTGAVTPAQNGKFTFFTMSKDGVRLWVNDQLLIENVRQHQLMENQGELELPAGQPARIRLEYYELGSNSVAKLVWSGPNLEKTVIPAASLTPAGLAGVRLKGEYFEDRRMKQRALTRVDATVDFDWPGAGPFLPHVGDVPVTLKLDLPAGKYQMHWIDPKTGRTLGRNRFDHAGGVKAMVSPAFTEDIALKVTRR
jgi:hypothetical protein